MARELGSDTPLGRAAAQLAQQQETLAGQFEQLADDPAERRAAQDRSQQQLATATDNLARQIAGVASRMTAEPISAPEQGQAVGDVSSITSEAAGAMRNAQSQMQQQNLSQAGQNADDAAAGLRAAAELAQRLAGARQEMADIPVPDALADLIASAMQNLQQAQQELNQPPGSGQNAEGASEGPNASQSPASSESASGEQPGAEGQTSQPSSSLAKSADLLQQAADALAQASEQLGQGNSDGAGSESEMAGTQSEGSSEGDGGGGHTGGDVDLAALERELERMSGRQWGQLPGTLRTEILQAAGRRSQGEYGKLIQMYFREISRVPVENKTPRQ